jgi:hypothetical protein
MELDKLIDRYIAGLQRDFDSKGFTNIKRGFATEEGRKYIKIVDGYVQDNGELESRSVVAFIEKTTGDVYKPAGWQAPAKGVRFNLYKDIDYLENNCGGGHLYR